MSPRGQLCGGEGEGEFLESAIIQIIENQADSSLSKGGKLIDPIDLVVSLDMSLDKPKLLIDFA